MDKKLKNRIVYVVVAGLWSMALYRTWQNHQIDQEIDASKEYVSDEYIPLSFNKDTFELILPDRDPFLNEFVALKPAKEDYKKPSTSDHKKNQSKTNPLPVKQLNWPRIEYLGFVRNRSEKDPLCLVKINGQNRHLSKGEEYNGLYITSIYRDSIHVVYSGEEKTVTK